MEKEGVTDRYDAEEKQYEYVAHGNARKQGGVEKAEDHTCYAHQYALPASPPHERKSCQACQQCGYAYADAHGRQCYPALRACSFWTQTVLGVHATDAVEIVVHQIGVHLHEQGKGQAQKGRNPVDVSVDAIGGRKGQYDRSSSTGECLGPGGKAPGMQGISLYHVGKVNSFFWNDLNKCGMFFAKLI